MSDSNSVNSEEILPQSVRLQALSSEVTYYHWGQYISAGYYWRKCIDYNSAHSPVPA